MVFDLLVRAGQAYGGYFRDGEGAGTGPFFYYH